MGKIEHWTKLLVIVHHLLLPGLSLPVILVNRKIYGLDVGVCKIRYWYCVFFTYQALQNQKRKTDEAKSESSSLQRELSSMSETCQSLEQARHKLQNELSTKENQNSFLNGQLNNAKSNLEKELAKVRKRYHHWPDEMRYISNHFIHSLTFSIPIISPQSKVHELDTYIYTA